jgi:dihydrofolate reductase
VVLTANNSSKVVVYLACSIDGFIAGVDHSLDWLMKDYKTAHSLPQSPSYLEFDAFMTGVGCLLMGRKTFDVVQGLGEWVYGETPVIVATRRPLTPPKKTVEPSSGPIITLIEKAKSTACGKNVYLDGGDLVRQAIGAGLVDEITITYIPIILGNGVRLFELVDKSISGEFTRMAASGKGHVQISTQLKR